MTPFKSWFASKDAGLKCAAVTPIGPGHVERARECRASIEAAWRVHRGPFSALEFCFIDDSRGELGRSKARNLGVQAALEARADWIFFLDADDLMTPRAFSLFGEYADRFDAVWGLMAIKPPAEPHHIRFPQALTLQSIDELLLLDPFMTLLMGHFVRASAAVALPFDESIDAGEDFDYYIRAWERFRCVKIAEVLSVNRSDQHSSGPRAATADQWRTACAAQLAAAMQKRGLIRDASRAIDAVNRCSAEAQAFSRARGEASAANLGLFAKRLPYRGPVEVNSGTGGDFVLFSNNDDVMALSVGWTGDYLPATTRLWQALATGANTILDIGAYTGYFGLLAARAAPTADITCFEPLTANFARLESNLALNEVSNVRALRAGVAGRNAEMTLQVPAGGEGLCLAATLADDGRTAIRSEKIETLSIDGFLGAGCKPPVLIRIDAGAAAPDIVAGAALTLERVNPDLIIAVEDAACAQRLESELRQRGYRFYAVDEDRESIVASNSLWPAAADYPAYRWATSRSVSDAERVIDDAHCSPRRVIAL